MSKKFPLSGPRDGYLRHRRVVARKGHDHGQVAELERVVKTKRPSESPPEVASSAEAYPSTKDPVHAADPIPPNATLKAKPEHCIEQLAARVAELERRVPGCVHCRTGHPHDIEDCYESQSGDPIPPNASVAAKPEHCLAMSC